MKQIAMSVFLLAYLLAPNSPLAQSKKDIEKATKIIKRQKTISNEANSKWLAVFEARFPHTLNAQSLKSTYIDLFLHSVNCLWKDDTFQNGVSDKLLVRIPLISDPVLSEWLTALAKPFERSAGLADETKMFTLCFIARQDRLFDGTKYKGDESKVFLKRFESVPKDSIIKWYEATDPLRMGGSDEAAVSIIEEDAFFNNNMFQQDSFTKKLNEILAAKK